jgi:hypothetical protein
MADLVLSQNDDFLEVELDGVVRRVDVLRAYDAFGKIDFAHKDDPWWCYGCQGVAQAPALGEVDPKCSVCGAVHPVYCRDQKWLDDVVAYVVGLGWSVVGQRAAAEFYGAIVDKMAGVKKNTTGTSASPTGSASTPPVGPSHES